MLTCIYINPGQFRDQMVNLNTYRPIVKFISKTKYKYQFNILQLLVWYKLKKWRLYVIFFFWITPFDTWFFHIARAYPSGTKQSRNAVKYTYFRQRANYRFFFQTYKRNLILSFIRGKDTRKWIILLFQRYKKELWIFYSFIYSKDLFLKCKCCNFEHPDIVYQIRLWNR